MSAAYEALLGGVRPTLTEWAAMEATDRAAFTEAGNRLRAESALARVDPEFALEMAATAGLVEPGLMAEDRAMGAVVAKLVEVAQGTPR